MARGNGHLERYAGKEGYMAYFTEYLNNVTDPGRPWAFIDDSEENILNHLTQYTLDPVFEDYGDFVNHSQEWLCEEAAEKYRGCAVISGNFLEFSHAFRLVTNDPALIERLSAAIARNKSSDEYQAAKKRLIEQKKQEMKEREEKIKRYGHT